MNLHKMIEICLKDDNMHIFVMINALIFINNYVITYIISMLSTILLDPIGKLEHVPHVPQLFISLISVQKVASLYPYKIEFDELNTFLYNKVKGWKTRLVEFRQGIYYLLTNRPPQEIVREAESHILPPCNTLANTRRKDELRLIHP